MCEGKERNISNSARLNYLNFCSELVSIEARKDDVTLIKLCKCLSFFLQYFVNVHCKSLLECVYWNSLRLSISIFPTFFVAF